MRRNSLPARVLAFAAVFALAFAQVAMAAFAPMAAQPQMAHAMAADDGCAMDDPGAKHLCMKECQAEPQKGEMPTLAALPPAPDRGLRVELAPLAIPSGRQAGDEGLLARATAPPLQVLFARFLE